MPMRSPVANTPPPAIPLAKSGAFGTGVRLPARGRLKSGRQHNLERPGLGHPPAMRHEISGDRGQRVGPAAPDESPRTLGRGDPWFPVSRHFFHVRGVRGGAVEDDNEVILVGVQTLGSVAPTVTLQ